MGKTLTWRRIETVIELYSMVLMCRLLPTHSLRLSLQMLAEATDLRSFNPVLEEANQTGPSLYEYLLG